MGKRDLLKHANQNKPVEFTKEFKQQLDKAIHDKLSPEIDDSDDKDKGDEE